MNEAKIRKKVEQIFGAWYLKDHGIDEEIIDDILSALREAYVNGYENGYENGFSKCFKVINKAKKDLIN